MTLRFRTNGLAGRARDWTALSADLKVYVGGPCGSGAITPQARDVLRVGSAVFAIERALSGSPGRNRPVEFWVELTLERPDLWTAEALDALGALLEFQSDAHWNWTLRGGARPTEGIDHVGLAIQDRTVHRVVLFSGGLDSTSGIALDDGLAGQTQLVSHYSRQKSVQRSLAGRFGYGLPTQARISGATGRGRGFLHRSFYFLCLAAFVAETYGARRLIQYENGVLALAIRPYPSFLMTRHAHPRVHQAATRLFTAILGGDWSIENPFLKLTKRQCFEARLSRLVEGDELLSQIESCWYANSNQQLGGIAKAVGKPCGVCVPCLVRRTATRIDEGEFDPLAAETSDLLKINYDAYRIMIDQILARGPRKAFLELPSYTRGLVTGAAPVITQTELLALLERFANDYAEAF